MHHRVPSFFDLETPFAKIYELNNFLPKLKQLIPWENFRPTLEQIHHKDRLSFRDFLDLEFAYNLCRWLSLPKWKAKGV